MRQAKDEPHLVIFDLDGTALKSILGSELSLRLKKAIIKSRTDIAYSIATGRSWPHVGPVITDIAKYLKPCIISGGSQIIHPGTGNIIWEISLSHKQIEELNSIAIQYEKLLSFNHGITTHNSVVSINNSSPTIVYMLGITSLEIESIYKIVSQIEDIHAAITNAWGNTGEFVLHITHKNANKGSATKALLKILDINKENTVAIGDGLNDLPMFNMVGTSLAVKGSLIESEQIITGTVNTLEEDGVAQFIESLQNKILKKFK